MPKAVRHTLLALTMLAIVVPLVLVVTGVMPYRVYVVHTGSMSPTIPSKSAVIVREARYRLGQVITYQTPNGIVTHRLVKQNTDGTLVTKGDANRTADPSSIRPSSVIGSVVAAPRMAGYWITYFKNPAGLASLFLTVLCAWLLYSLPSDFARRQQPQKPGVARSAPIAPPLRRPFAHPPRSDQSRRQESAQPSVILLCSKCGATFLTGDELRTHLSAYAVSSLPTRRAEKGSRMMPPPSLRRRAQ